jgi:Cu(I)/Ag(I) efflux system membrane fusion protein
MDKTYYYLKWLNKSKKMKIKKTITILAILILGIVIGKFAFNNNVNHNKHTKETKEEHWTCSMHPEIDLPEFGPCPKCGMDLIPKTNDNEGLASNEFKLSKNAIALAKIETMVIGGRDVLQNVSTQNESTQSESSKTLKLSGKIMVNDRATSIQTAHFGGRLESLKYRSIGEYVKKGSLVATVYSPDLVSAQSEFIEALNIKYTQPELCNAVRNKLKNWKISEQQIQQIEQTKTVITNFNIYANVSGYIDEILVQAGNHVNEGSPLFKVSNLGNVWAVFDVYEQDIKHLKIGQRIVIKANAYPEKEIKTRINFINPNLNVSTRTVQVRATLSNSKSKLKPGMLLSGLVQLPKTNVKSNGEEVVEIPKSAVLWTGKRSIVYIKKFKDEPVFELREVTLGNANGDSYQIISGLENGDEIVVNGTFTVDAAAQLQGKNSMMNKMKKEELKVKSKRIKVNLKFKKQLKVVFQDYINLKDAFVLTDVKKVSALANHTLINLQKVKMSLLKNEDAHKIWMQEHAKIKVSLNDIKREKDIEKQRAKFITLSNAMINLASSFGVSKTIYVQHCPMANDNQGADWLSSEKAIRNPYFGDKMLQCGSVKQKI